MKSPVTNLYVWEWSMFLHESEFLGRVYDRWPYLRELPIGTEVKVIVDTTETLKRREVYAPNSCPN